MQGKTQAQIVIDDIKKASQNLASAITKAGKLNKKYSIDTPQFNLFDLIYEVIEQQSKSPPCL